MAVSRSRGARDTRQGYGGLLGRQAGRASAPTVRLGRAPQAASEPGSFLRAQPRRLAPDDPLQRSTTAGAELAKRAPACVTCVAGKVGLCRLAAGRYDGESGLGDGVSPVSPRHSPAYTAARGCPSPGLSRSWPEPNFPTPREDDTGDTGDTGPLLSIVVGRPEACHSDCEATHDCRRTGRSRSDGQCSVACDGNGSRPTHPRAGTPASGPGCGRDGRRGVAAGPAQLQHRAGPEEASGPMHQQAAPGRLQSLDRQQRSRQKGPCRAFGLAVANRIFRRSTTGLRVLAALLPVLVLGSPGDAAEHLTGSARVVDGDTVVIGSTSVRLNGIDAPETDQVCVDAAHATWTCGIAARDALSVKQQASWDCAITGHDRYGRSLATCRVEAARMSASGWPRTAGRCRSFAIPTPTIATKLGPRRAEGSLGRRLLAPWDWRARNSKTSFSGATSVPIDAQRILLSPASAAEAPSPECIIKGNVNRSGECIYHVPGGAFYSKVKMKPGEGDRWFCTAEEAEAAGAGRRSGDEAERAPLVFRSRTGGGPRTSRCGEKVRFVPNEERAQQIRIVEPDRILYTLNALPRRSATRRSSVYRQKSGGRRRGRRRRSSGKSARTRHPPG